MCHIWCIIVLWPFADLFQSLPPPQQIEGDTLEGGGGGGRFMLWFCVRVGLLVLMWGKFALSLGGGVLGLWACE